MSKTPEYLAKQHESKEHAALRRRMNAWLDGWRCGAAFLPVSDECECKDNEADFTAGWTQGRADKRKAVEVAEKLYGEKVGIVRLARLPGVINEAD